MSTIFFGQVAGVISFVAYLVYIFTTIQGQTKPNRATWWILTLVGVMIATSYYAGGARDTMWVAVSYIAGPLIIAILSLWYGEGKWETLDKICLTGAIISAIIWYFSSSALIVLSINLLMDFLGLIPTIKKSYLRPMGEDKIAWTMESFAGTLNMFAIETFTFAIVLYPLYILIINLFVTLLLYRPMISKYRQKFFSYKSK